MAIQVSPRTAIMAGAAVLVLAGAGAAYFFLLEEEPPPPPPKAAAKPPAAPAKAAADKPAAKPAAAKPIPQRPDLVIAEVMETSGIKASIAAFGREVMANVFPPGQASQIGLSAAEQQALADAVARIFDPAKMSAEYAASLKNGYDAVRMPRLLLLLREPISAKLVAQAGQEIPPDVLKEFAEKLRKEPPSPERVKLIEAIDELTRASEFGADLAAVMARDIIDAMLDALQKAGKPASREARQALGAQLQAMREQVRSGIRTRLYAMYRDASEEDLAEYAKTFDTETGRWGFETLTGALKPVMLSRGPAIGREIAQFALAAQKAPPKAAAAARPKAAEETAAAAPPKPAPAEPPAYRRPEGIKTLYARYNDLITAVVMRDPAAVRELLADGKSANVRQSDGLTALMVAAANGDLESAQLLLAKGADPNSVAPGPVTALSLAKEAGHAQLVKLLERHGAKN
jgi:hypothetical protein